MTTLRCLIIDDEPLAHKVILEYAKEVPFIDIAGQCYLAAEALTVLNSEEIDLIFLDIQMPRLKGLELLRSLKKQPIVIITSAYEEYALESFELDVCDYLLKPFRLGRFLKAVNKAFELHQLKHIAKTPPPAPPEKARQLFIKVDKKHLQVDPAEIYYLESYGNYVKVWLKDTFHLTPRTLSSFEEDLKSPDFIRIHKSYLINRKYLDYVEGNTLYLSNKQELPIGKTYRQLIRQLIS